ncbi:MAG: EamA family transporter [Saprospiraceae bacterium]|nr:EamA family transporter [Saprospiraceae bacterium]
MPERWLIIGAFAVIYIVWGSTYLVNFWAIQVIPPFLMSGSRFFTAGLLLYLFFKPKEVVPISRKQFLNALVLGFLFLTVGAGGVVWAEQYIDTGMVALIIAFDPLLILLLLWIIRGKRPKGLSLLGTALGIAGMALLVDQPQFIASKEAIWGLIAISISMTAWAFASIYISSMDLPASKSRSTALQMLGGGTCLFLVGGLSGELADLDFSKVNLNFTFSWLYLVFLGSLLAFSCFNYLLTKVSPAKVATSTYVNPVVALWMGWAFNAELISTQSLLAAGILLSGVIFINSQ